MLPKTVQTSAEHASLQITTVCYEHLFRSARHNAVMKAIADGTQNDRPPERHRSQSRKWSDIAP